MIREYIGKKAAEKIDRSKYGDTKVGRITSTILDDERLENIHNDGLNAIGSDLNNPYLRYRMLAFAIAVNSISWLAVFLLPSAVSKLVLACSLIFSKGGTPPHNPGVWFYNDGCLFGIAFLVSRTK